MTPDTPDYMRNSTIQAGPFKGAERYRCMSCGQALASGKCSNPSCVCSGKILGPDDVLDLGLIETSKEELAKARKMTYGGRRMARVKDFETIEEMYNAATPEARKRLYIFFHLDTYLSKTTHEMQPDKPYWKMTLGEFRPHSSKDLLEPLGIKIKYRMPVNPETGGVERGTSPEEKIFIAIIRDAVSKGEDVAPFIFDAYPYLAPTSWRKNWKYSSIEISFKAKQPDKITEKLSKAGFKWDSWKKVWQAKDIPKNRELATSLGYRDEDIEETRTYAQTLDDARKEEEDSLEREKMEKSQTENDQPVFGQPIEKPPHPTVFGQPVETEPTPRKVDEPTYEQKRKKQLKKESEMEMVGTGQQTFSSGAVTSTKLTKFDVTKAYESGYTDCRKEVEFIEMKRAGKLPGQAKLTEETIPKKISDYDRDRAEKYKKELDTLREKLTTAFREEQ